MVEKLAIMAKKKKDWVVAGRGVHDDQDEPLYRGLSQRNGSDVRF